MGCEESIMQKVCVHTCHDTVAAAALWGRPLTHSTERTQHLQESLVDSMGSGYPTMVQRAPQIVSSLMATVEPGAHMDPSRVVDPND